MWEWLLRLWQKQRAAAATDRSVLCMLRRWLAACSGSAVVSGSPIPKVRCDSRKLSEQQRLRHCCTWVNKKRLGLLKLPKLCAADFFPHFYSLHTGNCASGFSMERLQTQMRGYIRGRDGLHAWCLSAFGVIPSSPRAVMLVGSIWNGIELDRCKGFTQLGSLSLGLFLNCPSMHTSCAVHGQNLQIVTRKSPQPRTYSPPLWAPKCPEPCEV